MARNPSLEQLIANDPDDPQNYLVYGDWLTAQGDPRGELVAVQHALSVDRTGPLIARERAILEANDEFRPASKAFVEAGFRWGFIQRLAFNNGEDWMDDDAVDAATLAAEVLASPALAGLTSLELGILRWQHVEADVSALLQAFGESAYGKQIRSLRIGPSPADNVDVGMHLPGRACALVSRSLPNLEELTIVGTELVFGAMDLPKLRTLRIESCGLTRENLASITSAKWPKVERAELLFGSANYGCDVELADLEPILEGETFPSVRHLGLMNSELADAIAARIVRSKVLERLETLDLSLGTMARDGARALLENAPALAHLELLDVNENYLTAEEVSTLQALGRPAVRSKEQKKDDDSIPGEIYRYVTVAE